MTHPSHSNPPPPHTHCISSTICLNLDMRHSHCLCILIFAVSLHYLWLGSERFLLAAAASAPAGVVSAFAEPGGWCAGAVLDVAGCAVCASAAPSSWQLLRGSFDWFCCPHTSVLRPQPTSLHFHVCEAQVPCSSTSCPGRPPHTLPHSVGRACAGRVSCWLRVVCASWLTRVACVPAWCPGCFTLHCDRAVVLGSAHPSFVGDSFPCLAHHSFPQGASGAPAVAHWVLDPWAQMHSGAVPQGPQDWLPGCLIPCAHWWLHGTHQGPQWWPTGCRVPCARTNIGAALQGPQGCLPRCLIPCAHWWLHRTPQGPQWWPTGCWVPWAQADKDFALQGPQGWPSGCWVPWAQADKDFALQGPQGWPSGCPIPCAHSPFHVTPQGPCWPTGSPVSQPTPL